MNFRVWTLQRFGLSVFPCRSKSSEALVESFFFDRYLRRKLSHHSLVQGPQFVNGKEF
jgi:hypothetical protein